MPATISSGLTAMTLGGRQRHADRRSGRRHPDGRRRQRQPIRRRAGSDTASYRRCHCRCDGQPRDQHGPEHGGAERTPSSISRIWSARPERHPDRQCRRQQSSPASPATTGWSAARAMTASTAAQGRTASCSAPASGRTPSPASRRRVRAMTRSISPPRSSPISPRCIAIWPSPAPNVVITLDAADTITLKGVTLASLTAADFTFHPGASPAPCRGRRRLGGPRRRVQFAYSMSAELR